MNDLIYMNIRMMRSHPHNMRRFYDAAGIRELAVVGNVLFMFATTKQGLLDDAFRSRCTEILLQPYSQSEIEEMVKLNYPDLPADAVPLVARASRLVPRRAFMLARDVAEELADTGKPVETCFAHVMYGLGIVSRNGLTHDDLAYLDVLVSERRPLGERVITPDGLDAHTRIKARLAELPLGVN